MYRISVTQPAYRPSTAPGAFKLGYFGPCDKEDLEIYSESDIRKFKNPENYIDINMLVADSSRRKLVLDFLNKFGIGSRSSYSAFRKNNNYTVTFCSKGKGTNPTYILFLRKDLASYFGYPDEPFLINTWDTLEETTRQFIAQNSKLAPDRRQGVSRYGKEIAEVLYTGTNQEISKHQKEVFGNKPTRLYAWGIFLENDVTRKPNTYISSKALLEASKADLPPDEKQELYNRVIERYYFGFSDVDKFKLYKYTVPEDSPNYNPETAKLTTSKIVNDKTGFSRNRSIVTDGFSLREWEDLVFKKKVPKSIKSQSDEQIENWLNGISDFSERITPVTYKLRYTGNNPLTIKKLGLTGILPNVYYTKTEWYASLAKIRYVETILGIKQNQDLKIGKLKDPQIQADIMSKEYMDAFKNEIPLNKELLVTVGNYFRQNSLRFSINTNADIINQLQEANADSFSINSELKKLQTLDNLFIDKLYTNSTGTTGEQVMLGSLTKSKDVEYKRTKSFNVTDPYGRSYTLIFDGAIYKDNRLVMLAEYQGAQHYHYNSQFYRNYDEFQDALYRDKLKQDFCRKNNIPLITISHALSPVEAKKIYDDYVSKGLLNYATDLSKEDVPDLTLPKEDPETMLNNYVDSIVTSHFGPFVNTGNFEYLNHRVKDIMIDLSKLVMIMINNLQSENMSDTTFMQNFSKQTLLDEGHKKLVDSFNKIFGDIYKMDYSDNVTYSKVIYTPKTTPAVSEFAFHGSFPKTKKKRYKIRVK